MSNFIVSARKYRPSTFNSVIGQEAIVTTLKNAIKNNQAAQAFLFCGPRGVGKTSCARILAKTINCHNLSEEIEPCNECESCSSFNNQQSVNIYELDAASNNSVEDIRRLVEQVRYPPSSSKEKKIYIIDEVHMLSPAAFNAFLKTLEEPPKYAIFILATTEKQKIIPTILSRCQIFDFKRVSVTAISDKLAEIAKIEEIIYEKEALAIIGQKAQGGVRDALSMFDQLSSFTDKNLSYKAIAKILNILDEDYFFKLIDAITTHDISNCLLTLNDIIEMGFDEQLLINGLATHIRNLIIVKEPKTTKLLATHAHNKERYITQSNAISLEKLLLYLSIVAQTDLNLKNSQNLRLSTEIALMELCSYDEVTTQKKKD